MGSVTPGRASAVARGGRGERRPYTLTVLLPALRWFNSNAAIAAVLGYLGLFGLAFLLMFLFPLGSIVLIFVGLIGLGCVVPVIAAAAATERWLNRRSLNEGRCPYCHAEVLPSAPSAPSAPSGETTAGGSNGFGCLGCGREFGQDGSAREPAVQSSHMEVRGEVSDLGSE